MAHTSVTYSISAITHRARVITLLILLRSNPVQGGSAVTRQGYAARLSVGPLGQAVWSGPHWWAEPSAALRVGQALAEAAPDEGGAMYVWTGAEQFAPLAELPLLMASLVSLLGGPVEVEQATAYVSRPGYDDVVHVGYGIADPASDPAGTVRVLLALSPVPLGSVRLELPSRGLRGAAGKTRHRPVKLAPGEALILHPELAHIVVVPRRAPLWSAAWLRVALAAPPQLASVPLHRTPVLAGAW
jgi:hypothetical protein